MDRWNLTEETKIKCDNLLMNYLIANESFDEINVADENLSPAILRDYFKDLNYEEIDYEENGWEMEFWFYFSKGNQKVTVSGCGMTFDLYVSIEIEND